MASLRIENVSKNFGKIIALSNLNFYVEDGEFCVLLGPSGCGKSTFLEIVAGLTRQDEGTVLIDEQPVDDLSPRKRDVAMVFQNYALYPHMTVARNLGFGLRMRGVSEEMIEKRILETAKFLGITDLLGRRPRELSGGQRQRVAMGRALARRPKLFLLDEPLSNLDARLRINVRLELKRLHEQIKSTILYVTHDQVEAMTLGDKVVVMREGKVHQIDRPETIYNKPADTFVATFIGSPIINLFRGEVSKQKEGYLVKTKDFTLGPFDGDIALENKEVEIGIRPEDISVSRKTGDGLEAEVEMVTNVGAEKYVHTRVGSTNLTAITDKQFSLTNGQFLYLGIDLTSLHFFKGGKRI